MYTNLVMTPDFTQIIQESLEELLQRVREREATDKRIAQLTKALRGLAVMLPEKERAQFLSSLKVGRRKGLGLTEVILEILRDSDGPLSANDIRDRMEDMGFDFTDYAQATATIYNTLRRLTENKRVLPVFPKDGAKTMLYKIGAAGLLKKIEGD
jgi:hypothetical protein